MVRRSSYEYYTLGESEAEKVWLIHYYRDRGLSYYKGLTANLEEVSKILKKENRNVVVGELCRDEYPEAQSHLESSNALASKVGASYSFIILFKGGKEISRLGGFPVTGQIMDFFFNTPGDMNIYQYYLKK